VKGRIYSDEQCQVYSNGQSGRNKYGGDEEFKTLNCGYLANIRTCQKVAIWKTYQNLKLKQEISI